MIECQDVSFSYPASTLPDSERQAGGALKHISCTIEDGSFVLLCGTSGCGKTTMTRLFNGLIPHYHEGTYTGSVYLDGKDTRDLSLFDISLKVGSANGRLAEILSALHPTPAVGGYPKELAMEWIRRVEPHERRYYGGYLGPMFGEHVRLFVNLRCMEVDDSRLRLYVGGGLTDKSDPESEWKETEAKAQTLLSIINGYK